MCDSWPPTGRARPRRLRLASRRARTSSSRRGVSLARRRKHPRLEPGQAGRRRPGARARPAARTARTPTSDETGFPGSPKTSVEPRTPNETGLPGLDRDSPEDLFDAELGLDSPDEVVRADRDAARGHEHVVLEPARDRLAMGVLVVGDRRQALDRSARRRRAAPRGSARSPRRSRRARAARRVGEARFPWRPRRPAGCAPHATSATPAAASAPSCAGPRRVPGRHDARRRRGRRRREDGHSRRSHAASGISHRRCHVRQHTRWERRRRRPRERRRRSRSPSPRRRERASARVGQLRRARRRAASRARPPRGARSRPSPSSRTAADRRARRPARRARGPAAELERNSLGTAAAARARESSALRLVDRQQLGHDRRIPYARRIGSAAVISVVVPVHDEERSVALLYEELDVRAPAARPAAGRRCSSTTARPTARSRR